MCWRLRLKASPSVAESYIFLQMQTAANSKLIFLTLNCLNLQGQLQKTSDPPFPTMQPDMICTFWDWSKQFPFLSGTCLWQLELWRGGSLRNNVLIVTLGVSVTPTFHPHTFLRSCWQKHLGPGAMLTPERCPPTRSSLQAQQQLVNWPLRRPLRQTNNIALRAWARTGRDAGKGELGGRRCGLIWGDRPPFVTPKKEDRGEGAFAPSSSPPLQRAVTSRERQLASELQPDEDRYRQRGGAGG